MKYQKETLLSPESYGIYLSRYSPDRFEALWDIMECSFPPEELYRSEQLLQHMDHPVCSPVFIHQKVTKATNIISDKAIGALIAWDFPDFYFGEYLAILPEMRNRGNGEDLMYLLPDSLEKPILFECEPPKTDIARRRINFYRRCGYFVYDREYLMPALHPEDAPIPMHLMGGGKNPLKNENLKEAVDLLYKSVYCDVMHFSVNDDLMR